MPEKDLDLEEITHSHDEKYTAPFTCVMSSSPDASPTRPDTGKINEPVIFHKDSVLFCDEKIFK